ncbi:TfoX/Sxy family protein [Vibrio sp. SCSIO 43135]|uniref:TfoX/Sxy family protein n=1 Tax=Vibrio sp. SCSIO 43135 TaxID=2819096 RepID=UPI0020757469|nr:TfoX/Sxy family protein [Vibrio sp. SCSIO 43135]USD40089.1 TfoX/Sxy family protein [Vibrio sp. SCSIO 43135]
MNEFLDRYSKAIVYKPMFGGYGCFINKRMFGLIVDGEFHIRSSDKNMKNYHSLGWEQHTYTKKGGHIARTRYFRVPDADMQKTEKLSALINGALKLDNREIGRYITNKKVRNLSDFVSSRKNAHIFKSPTAH